MHQKFQDFLKNEADRHDISRAEREALILAMDGYEISTIAERLGVKPEAVRQRLSQVYHKFNIEGRGPVKLAKLQQLLRARYQEYQARSQEVTGADGTTLVGEEFMPRWELSEAPDVSMGFYGRQEQLETLQKWVLQEQCRLVSIIGLADIGKTYLAAKLTHQIKDKFDCVVWKSLHRTPPLHEFLEEILLLFVNKKSLPEDTSSRMTLFMDCLRQYRCLIVFDEVERILRGSDRFGRYQEAFEDYGILLRRIGSEQHQSCLVLTSWENPLDVHKLQGATNPVRSVQLSGLTHEEAREILENEGLGGEEEWEWLIETYRGHPLNLKLIAQTIQELFEGDVAAFKEFNTLLIGNTPMPLQEHFQRLSPLERRVVEYLATEMEGEAVSFPELLKGLKSPPLGTSELIEALESLKQRSLVEPAKTGSGSSKQMQFCLQPIVKKYIQTELAESTTAAE
jgi:DNA-binding CsgD family transcriptional regulator